MLLKVFILLIECVESTKNITLHSKQLEISSSKTKVIEIASSDVCKISEQKYIADLDFYIIYLETSLKKEFSYLIYLEYRGNLMDGLAGYYKSGYLDRNKKNHWLAVTQFEPTDARRAFPCFDEPNLKASFQISLGRKKRYKTISNMKLAHTVAMRSKPGWFWDKYEISLPMSTYLVAFVISDFGFQTASHGHNNITFNIWARNNALNQVEFAKEVCPKVLAFYEQYFRFNYPLNKLDMIALPDFNAGAMENWGLITFREIYLLLDPKSYSISNKYKISSVIAHELAHQWFGNLVTMKWWTDLWLNEGFATYMAGIAIHSLYPSWNSLNEEAVTTLLQVYALDSLKSSHPVSLAIHNVNEINQMFDTISYKKGSFLIRMMSHFLTETILQKGVSYYLKQHAYSNAEQDDLWDALTEQAHTEHILPHQFTVKHIMDTWTLQIGYPLINVIRNYDNGIVEITQERFYKNVIHKPLKEQCWWIPLTYTTNQFFNNTKPRLWMSCPKKMKKLRIKNANDWIIFNIQATGLYRVNYDETNWKMIITYLKKMTRFQIPEINRVLLIDNAMELAWIGHLKYDIAFDLLLYIKNDLNYLPWETALQKLESISNVLKRTPYHEHIQSFIKTLIYPVYMRLDGFNISKEKWKSLDGIKYQSLIARTACKYKVDECNRKTLELFESWRSNPKKSNTQFYRMTQDIQLVVYCDAIRQGDEADWDFLWQKYKQSNAEIEKNTILNALGCTRKAELLYRYLEWSIKNNTYIRKQDCFTVFNSVSNNYVGYFIAKTFFQNNLKEISDRISPNGQRIASYVQTLAKQINNEKDQEQFKSFLKENMHYLEKAKIAILQSLEIIDININWYKRNSQHIRKVLNHYLTQL